MSEPRYTLDELADLTGLKPRTIRHYIQQTLLLGPDSLGRNATYSDYHRKRLEVIRNLRSRRFSIEDIREAFRQAKPDEEIRVAVVPQESIPSMDIDMDAAAVDDDDSALAFVRSRQQAMAPHRDEDLDVVPSVSLSSGVHKCVEASRSPSSSGPIEEVLLKLRALTTERVTPRTRGERWVRYSATPDFEIHVRGEVPAEQHVLFEQIADHIRHILLGGDSHD